VRGDSPETFVAYRCGPFRGLCVSGYETFDLAGIPWDKLKGYSDERHHLTKSSRTRLVVRLEFTPPGRPPRAVYAKRALVSNLRKRLGNLLTRSKARHEWAAGHRLLAMGLATARPVICAERRQGPWVRASYLVTEEIADARPVRLELEHLHSTRAQGELLGRLGEWLWQVHRRGFYHDDCSAQHVFVGPLDASHHGRQRQFWFIDLDGCRFHRATVPWGRRVKNLFQLLRSIPPRWASQADRLHLVRAYLTASGELAALDRALTQMRRLAQAKETSIHL